MEVHADGSGAREVEAGGSVGLAAGELQIQGETLFQNT